VIAFVAGSIVTGALAFADKEDKNPFKDVAKELKKISKAIEGIGTIKGEQGAQGEQGPSGVMNIYEVSAVSVVPVENVGGGNHKGNDVQLRCSDGDWFMVDDPQKPISMSFDDSIVLDNELIISRGSVVEESTNPNIDSGNSKPIGWNGRAEQIRGFQAVDIPVTITGLCVSPSP